MLTRWQFWSLTVLAVLGASLIAMNMWQFAENRRQQADVNQRTQFVQQTAPLEVLTREIVAALAQLAVRNKDDQVRALLSSLGMTVTEPSPSPATATQPAKK